MRQHQLQAVAASQSSLPAIAQPSPPVLRQQASVSNRAIAAQPQPIQAKLTFQGLSQELSEDLQSQRQSLLPVNGEGKQLPEAVQQKMETAFGTDFSDVRIHEGPEAQSINAIAYTRGSDIHFAPGKYHPESQTGQQLLGHELAHVIQQRAGRVSVPPDGYINGDRTLEHEADISGAKVAAGESVAIAGPNMAAAQPAIGVHAEQPNLASRAIGTQAQPPFQGLSQQLTVVQCAGLEAPHEHIDYYAHRFRNFGKTALHIGTVSKLKTVLDESKNLRAQWLKLEQDQTQGGQGLGWTYNPLASGYSIRIAALQDQYLDNLQKVLLGLIELRDKNKEKNSDKEGVAQANFKHIDTLGKAFRIELAWLHANRPQLKEKLRARFIALTPEEAEDLTLNR